MKKIALVLLLLLGFTSFVYSRTTSDKDTILVNFGKKGKMVIYVDTKEDFSALKSYDINAILSKLNMFTDSTNINDTINDSKSDTTFTFKVPVTVDGKRSDKLVQVKIESIEDKTKDISESLDAAEKNIEEAAKNLEKVTINLGKLHFEINDESGKNKIHITSNNKDTIPKKPKKRYFELHLGLNNYFQNGHFPTNENTPYALDLWRSRYFAIDFLNREKITGNWTFIYGIELAFNNYMFRDDVKITKVNGEVAYEPILDREIKKSKLATTYLNIPVMTKIKIGKFKIGAGGYGGYRLGSHGKIKYATGDNKISKNRSNFYLNDWRYGLKGTLGWKSFEIFANYDMNTLFKGTRGPQVNSFSFGVIL